MNFDTDLYDFDRVLNNADHFFDLKDDLPEFFSYSKKDNDIIADDE